MTSDGSEKVILEAVKKGDGPAYAALFDLYRPLIDSASRRFSENSGEEEDDCIQEAATALYLAALTYREEMSVSFGLYAKICMKNRFCDIARKKNRNVPVSVLFSEAEDMIEKLPSEENGPEEAAIEAERVSAIRAVIDERLTAYEKSVFGLYLRGIPCRTIAARLSEEPKSVENALGRAKKKLRTIFSE